MSNPGRTFDGPAGAKPGPISNVAWPAFILFVALLIPLSAQSASAKNFTNKSLKGTYRCAMNSDGNYENSVVVVSADGKGDASVQKVLVSADYICPNGLACTCTYSDSTGSYSINPDGSGSLTVNWTAGANDAACPTTGLTENWTIVLSKKSKQFFVATDNNDLGDYFHPGTGGCTKQP
jgi:hypothetical protein